jgi:hypothetical protein
LLVFMKACRIVGPWPIWPFELFPEQAKSLRHLMMRSKFGIYENNLDVKKDERE